MKQKKGIGLKNHVAPKTKTIGNVLQSKFGFSLADLDAALQGDKSKLQAIGEAARQGKLTQELMPILEQAYTDIIKGTEAYNTGTSRLLKQGANSAIAIDKATSQAVLANQKYINQRQELKAEFVAQRNAETARHQYQTDFIQLKSYIDQYLVGVDNSARLLEQSNRPELKQMSEDQRYETVAAKHLLEHGDSARLDLIPEREYVPKDRDTSKPGGSVMQRLSQIRQALGF